MTRCEICGRGPTDSPPVSVYRQNEKGVPGVWRCAEHNEQPVDPEIQEIVDIIEQDNE